MTVRNMVCSGFGAFALTAFIGCGSVNFGEEPKQVTQPQQDVTQDDNPMANVDCDALMQQLADSCFAVTAFDADGQTPLHVYDENGNDLGEVDQRWAADYCECYAQLAFQTFGCETVVRHQSVTDEEYDALYAPIMASCEEPPADTGTNPDNANPESTNPDNANPESANPDNANLTDGDAADQSLKEEVRPADNSDANQNREQSEKVRDT